jgi:hypothetical protein
MPYQPTTLPYDADQAYHITDHVVIWPFPQNFFFKNHHLVGTKERMYMVDALGKLTSLFSYDSTERWDIADFSDYMAITKDGSKMMSRSTGGAYNTDTSIPLCETLINLNGQLFVGNLKPWSSWSDVDGRFVGWSDIGSAVFSLDNKNEAGYRPHDFTGDVVQVKQLGNMAVAYGYNGISVFRPVIDPAPTFQYKNLSSIGLYNKGAVSGNERKHVFVGTDGYLYRLTEDLKLEQLGYQELIFQRISTLERYNGVKYGVSDDDTDTSFTAVTDRYDFGLKGRKGTEAIEVSCQGSGTFSAAIDWRNSPQESFQRTGWVDLNSQGVATIRCSATEFRFCIKCTDYTDVVLDRIKVRFKMEDMKSIRGVYAPPPRGQSAY